MKLALTAGLTLALAGSLLAESPKAANAPKDQKEKASYAIGMDMGHSVKAIDADLDPEFIAQGVIDTMKGKPALNEDEMQAALMMLQKEVQTKMEAKAGAAKDASEKFLEENKKKEGVVTTASGLQYKIVKEGKGPKPTATDTVAVKYKGTLIDGTEFDSTDKHGGQPAEFPVGAIIPGWSEALQLMPVGSTWELYIPAKLAYGERQVPGIGANQALIFTVELLEIKKPEAPAAAEGEKPAESGKKKK